MSQVSCYFQSGKTMSKIGEKTIEIPQGVALEVKDGRIHVKGQGGELSYALPKGITVVVEGTSAQVKRASNDKRTRALHGLIRSLVANAASGIIKPWEKTLEIVGTGFNVKAQGEELVLKLGYSHPVVVKKTEGIAFAVGGNNKITVKGIDKQLVGQVAYQIRSLKKPDVYKGKGIKYEGERLRIKPGKKAKTAGAA